MSPVIRHAVEGVCAQPKTPASVKICPVTFRFDAQGNQGQRDFAVRSLYQQILWKVFVPGKKRAAGVNKCPVMFCFEAMTTRGKRDIVVRPLPPSKSWETCAQSKKIPPGARKVL